MARIRSIKPEFWVSEQIAECSTNARLLFVGLWTFCDDSGVHPAKPATLKAEVFPFDSFSKDQMKEWIEELLKAGLVAEFAHKGEVYWHVTGWNRHQKIDKPSRKHPLPTDEDSESIRRTFDESSGTESSRVDRSGDIPPNPRKRGKVAQFPPGFDEFWFSYPRKQAKPDAVKAFAKLKPDAQTQAAILAAVALQSRSEQWTKDGGQFIPNPATWLNQRRWEDELIPKQAVYRHTVL